MMQTELFYRFGVALFIGFLIGLQREYSHGKSKTEMSAGVRTFSLIGLIGCTAALAADTLSAPAVLISLIVVVGALLTVGYLAGVRHGDMGLTTEVSALVTLLTGALCYWNYVALAVALAVVTTVLLSLKLELHTFVRHLTREDVYATLKFAVITAIILPVLPNQSYGPPPLDVLNPYEIWLMVVLISGMSFFGYVLIKLVGPRQGIGLTGLLGGLVSSTAVTLSMAQRSQKEEGFAQPFTLAILLSWVVMFPRILAIVAILNIELLRRLWLPIVASAAVGLVVCAYLYFARHSSKEGSVLLSNPFELGPALKFGLIYAAILLAARAGQIYLGDTGVYVSSLIAGLADVDAITLSLARFSHDSGSLEVNTAARAVVVAAMSNTVVKGGIVAMTGSSPLRRAILPGLILILVVGLSVAFLL